jgi:hypothetical protein
MGSSEAHLVDGAAVLESTRPRVTFPLRPTRLDVGQVVQGFPSRSPEGESLKRTRPATCAQRRRAGCCPRSGRAASDSQGSRTARQAQGPPLLTNVAMHEHLRRSVDIPATNRECGHACPWALRITPEAQVPSGARSAADSGSRCSYASPNRSKAKSIATLQARNRQSRNSDQNRKNDLGAESSSAQTRGSTTGQVTTATAACSRLMRVAGGSTGQSTREVSNRSRVLDNPTFDALATQMPKRAPFDRTFEIGRGA